MMPMSQYFIVRVTSSQEKISADILENKALMMNEKVYSIIVSDEMKGYIVVECEDAVVCKNLISNEPHVKGMISKPLTEEEVERLFAKKKEEQRVDVGDLVEFLSGPFKGYKAKVIKVDPKKDEMTVEIVDVAVSIPLKTKMENARIVEKGKR
ncbi:MAG: transcription elongation factor Spt5 [Candidatus Micrarchaeaceae archaeon]